MSGFRFAGTSSKQTQKDYPSDDRLSQRDAAATAAMNRQSAKRSPTLPDLPRVDSSQPIFRSSKQQHISNTQKSGKRKVETMLVLSDEDDDNEDARMEEMEEVALSAGDPVRPNRSTSHLKAIDPPNAEDLKADEDTMKGLDSEMASIEHQIHELTDLYDRLKQDREALLFKIRSRRTAFARTVAPTERKRYHQVDDPEAFAGSGKMIDYTRTDFEWSKRVKRTARDVFGIDSFRFCQEAAINANLGGQDVVSIMATGSGKSLTYQLPAVLARTGTTVVITPLISLMDDQCYNLRKLGIVAEMLNGSTTQEHQRAVFKRLLANSQSSATTTKPNAKGKGKSKVEELEPVEDGDLIKLVYVTPERIDKSKTFINTLQKMYDAGLLLRFVIDEAHCISTLGMDYRPSFLALKRLKALFPDVPIMATTATAPRIVVADMIKTLALPRRTSPGDAATPGTTIVFTSPLYRPNLRYEVKVKPSSAVAQVQVIVDYILEKHEGDIGIVYCLSRNDTEAVAQNLQDFSNGRITASPYHAGFEDTSKLRIYERWRQGKIQVVVSTIAFGLGIDNPNVRFVIHHTSPKSLSNLSQESGRAGRDGAPADCLLFWRPADASRLSTLAYEEFPTGGKERLYEMLSYNEDLKTCRKIAFARSFDKGADESGGMAAKFDDASTANVVCGQCDNCTRNPSTINSIDITLEVYRALRIVSAAVKSGGTLTMPQACDLVRGLGKGSFTTLTHRGGKSTKTKANLNLEETAGGKVELGKDETEQLLVRLLVEEYLEEQFHTSGWTTNSYLRPSAKATRFTRISPDAVSKTGVGSLPVRIVIDTRVNSSKKKRIATDGDDSKAKKNKKKKRKTSEIETIEIDDEDGGSDSIDDEEDERFDFPEEADPDEEEMEAMRLTGAETDGDWDVVVRA